MSDYHRGIHWVANDDTYIFWPNTAPAGTTTVYLYTIEGRWRFGVNASSVPAGTTAHNAEIVLNMSSMPTSSTQVIVPFASAVVTTTGSTASFGSLDLYDWPSSISGGPGVPYLLTAEGDGRPTPP